MQTANDPKCRESEWIPSVVETYDNANETFTQVASLLVASYCMCKASQLLTF